MNRRTGWGADVRRRECIRAVIRVLRHGWAEAWGDGKLGVDDFSAPAFAGLDLLGLFLDPVNWVVGKILEPILNWILENVKPLKKTIEVITGSPEQVQAQAAQYQRGEPAHRLGEPGARRLGGPGPGLLPRRGAGGRRHAGIDR